MRLPAAFPLDIYRQPTHDDRPIARLHIHDCLELGLCLEGAGIFVIGEKVVSFREGDATVITEHEPHFARSTPGTTSSWIWFWFKPTELLPAASTNATLPLSGRDFANLFEKGEGILQPILGAVVREYETRGPGWEESVRHLLSSILIQAHRRSVNPGHETSGGTLKRIGPALDFLARNHADPVDLSELAALCGMSLSHFRKEFGSAMGKSPHDYLTSLRLKAAAAQLADPSVRISEAAFAAGFETLSTFNRAFRAAFSCAPREWKRKTEKVAE